MSMYRKEWGCCGSITETEAWEPEDCPFCKPLAHQAEPVQPGAWVASKDGRVIYDDASTDDGLLRVSGDFENDEQRSRYAQRIVDKLNAALAQQGEPVQEPEGLDWRYTARIGYVVKPYTAPPQRKLVPLTEEEIDAEWHELDGEASALFKRVIRKFARAVEKASWEKNHGQA